MTWNDHTHSEYADERHDHDIDYAPLHHRHYDLEREDDRLQALISGMGDALGELQAAFDRICALEGANTRLTAALREATGRHEDTLRAGMADQANLAIAAELTEAFTSFSAALDGEPEQPDEEPEPYDPGPEVDDEGGMSEYRYPWPEDYQRGM